MERLYRLAAQSEDDPFEYVLSDETVDRYGDVIVASGWKLANFKKNPIALFGHDSDKPVGTWANVRVEAGRLIARLELAAAGTSARIDELRSLIAQRIIRAVSVGFQVLKRESLPDSKNGGYRYTACDLLECSLVSVPANPNALQLARSFDLPASDAALTFGKPAHKGQRSFLAVHGKPAKPLPIGRIPMKLSKRIEAAQSELTRLLDHLTTLSTKDDPTEDELALIDELPDTIEAAKKDLERHQRVEKALALATERNAEDDEIIPPDNRRPFAVAAKKIAPRDYILRTAVATFLGHIKHRSPEEMLRERYGEDETTMQVFRAVSSPANTTTPGWAAELVQTAIGDFLDSLKALSVYPLLRAKGGSYSFDRNGAIKIPSRASTPTLAGDFIGEGAPIPVRKLGLTSITLTPRKMGVISTFTRELAMHSTPSIEAVIRDAMAEDTATTIDTRLLDDIAATAIRPAGLRNGVAGLVPSVLTTATERMVADLKALVGAITAVNGGRDIVILLNTAQAMSIGFAQTVNGEFLFASTTEAGQRFGVTFISSANVAAGMVIAVDAADFITATGDVPEYDISEQATIHEEDTAPLPIATGVPGAGVIATPVRSLWQTASIGVRMLLDINWGVRRVGMVAWVTGVTW